MPAAPPNEGCGGGCSPNCQDIKEIKSFDDAVNERFKENINFQLIGKQLFTS